jgi:hypothetical protein
VVVNLTKTLDITQTGQSLYHTDLRSPYSDITGAQDRVSHFTDLSTSLEQWSIKHRLLRR